MTLKDYLKDIDEVSHITFNPKGIGVCRVHLIPPKKIKEGTAWTVIVNGQDILPLSLGWALLLREFIKAALKYDGVEVTEEQSTEIIDETIRSMKKIFPKTDHKILKDDLKDIISTLMDIGKGIEPPIEIGYMNLTKYAKYMRAPHRMDLMISSMTKDGNWHCNQKCLHCYASTEKESIKEELDTESWKKIIDKLKDECIPQITFTGGEPTLRDDLVELVEYSKWFVTRLNTNGVKLTEKLAKELYDASLDSVQITLYSDNADIHNLLTGSNHFDETVEGIKNAVKAGLNVSINTPLCSLNKNYNGLIEFAKSLGVKYFTCSGIIQTGNATDDDSIKTYLNGTEMLNILKEAVKYCKNNDLELSFTSPGWASEVELKKLKLNSPMCGASLSNMAIAPNGDVIPCQSWLNTEPLGNILTDSFKSIWKNRRCKEIRKVSTKGVNYCQLQKRKVSE